MYDAQEISIDLINDPQNAMRTEIDRNALFELADNIKQNGLINPITVRPVGDRFEVVAGHRRLSACKIAGKVKVLCIIRDLNENETFEIMAAENLERADVDPVDEATFLAEFMLRTNKSVAEVAKAVRRSVNYIESRLCIAQMPDYMREYLKNGLIKLGVALALYQITDERVRKVWVDLAVRDGVSVAQADYWLYGWKMNQLPGGSGSDIPPDGFEGAEITPIMFECAIDGKKYNAKLFRTIMIYEENLPFFKSIVAEIRAGASYEASAKEEN